MRELGGSVGYAVTSVVFSPVDLGIPSSRPRRYMFVAKSSRQHMFVSTGPLTNQFWLGFLASLVELWARSNAMLVRFLGRSARILGPQIPCRFVARLFPVPGSIRALRFHRDSSRTTAIEPTFQMHPQVHSHVSPRSDLYEVGLLAGIVL
jgi:hypothetical protein